MKKIITVLVVLVQLIACKNKTDETKESDTSAPVETVSRENNDAQNSNQDFDISTIKTSTADLGTFPFLSPPETYTYDYEKEIDPSDIKDFDIEYFAVNGKLIRVEGKSFKVRIEKDRTDGKRFNSLIVGKSYEEAILALGGVLVNNVTVPNSELERVGNKVLFEKGYGHSIDSNLLDDLKTYVIKTKDKEVWIQYSLMNDESGSITILEKAGLKTLAIKKISANEMQKEIDANGKAILNINFDTDKATLKPDGQTIVNEIFTLLSNNSKLKLSIEGHTDNTGSVSKNKQLSADRANTVMYALAAKGIDIKRLKASGFGSEKPLVTNDSEQNKAKNRRVELVKL